MATYENEKAALDRFEEQAGRSKDLSDALSARNKVACVASLRRFGVKLREAVSITDGVFTALEAEPEVID